MRGKKAKMMRRIVARVFNDDFRARTYIEAPSQSMHAHVPAQRLAPGSARYAYQQAKKTLHRRKLARG